MLSKNIKHYQTDLKHQVQAAFISFKKINVLGAWCVSCSKAWRGFKGSLEDMKQHVPFEDGLTKESISNVRCSAIKGMYREPLPKPKPKKSVLTGQVDIGILVLTKACSYFCQKIGRQPTKENEGFRGSCTSWWCYMILSGFKPDITSFNPLSANPTK